MRNLCRHADALAQSRMRVNRFADIHRIRTHLNRQHNLANHVTRMRAEHAAAQDLAVAVRFGGVIKQQLGDACVAAIGNGAAGGGLGKQTLLNLDALGARPESSVRPTQATSGSV